MADSQSRIQDLSKYTHHDMFENNSSLAYVLPDKCPPDNCPQARKQGPPSVSAEIWHTKPFLGIFWHRKKLFW